MSSLKEDILNKANSLFCQFGPSRVTMEEIAHEFGISKKTLYQYYSSKNDLLKEVTDSIYSQIQCSNQSLLKNSKMNFLEKINELIKSSLDNISRTEVLKKDLQKNFPELWKHYSNLHSQDYPEYLEKLLREGIAKGQIRRDINIPIVLMIFSSCLESLAINPASRQTDYSTADLIKEIHTVIFYGLIRR